LVGLGIFCPFEPSGQSTSFPVAEDVLDDVVVIGSTDVDFISVDGFWFGVVFTGLIVLTSFVVGGLSDVVLVIGSVVVNVSIVVEFVLDGIMLDVIVGVEVPIVVI
jgi:hypothetical protein